MKKYIKPIVVVVMVIVILAGLYGGYKYLWWFTPAHAQRQTVQTLFSDVTAGNMKDAYKLTSTSFQKKNSYVTMQSTFNQLSGTKLAIHYDTYKKQSNGTMTISGTIDNKTTNTQIIQFTANVTNGKIDAIALQNYIP